MAKNIRTTKNDAKFKNLISRDNNIKSNIAGYDKVTNVYKALTAHLQLMLSGVTYNKLYSQLSNEVMYNKDNFVKMNLKIHKASVELLHKARPVIEKSQYNSSLEMWVTENGIQTKQITDTKPIDIDHPLYNEYKDDPNIVQDVESLDLYNPDKLFVVKQLETLSSKYGLQFVSNPKKDPYQTESQPNVTKPYNVRLSSLLSVRKTGEFKEATSAAFMGPIMESISPSNTAVKDTAYRELNIVDRSCDTKITTKHGEEICGYNLKNRLFILDLDNGVQFKKIVNTLLNSPVIPQEIIVSKGIGATKKGNASLLCYFNKPLNKQERRLLTRAVGCYVARNADVYAFDLKCKGVGCFKNPIRLHNDKMINDVYFDTTAFNSATNQFLALDKETILRWAENEVEQHGDALSEDLCEQIKALNLERSESTLTELKSKIKEKLSQGELTETKCNKYWQPYVAEGERNDTLVVEASLIILGAEQLNSNIMLDPIEGSKQLTLLTADYIRSRYENHDGQMTDKYIQTRFKWAIEEDNNIIRSGEKSARKEYANAYMFMRNMLLKNPKATPFIELYCNAAGIDVPETREDVQTLFSPIPEFIKENVPKTNKFSNRSAQGGIITNQEKSRIKALGEIPRTHNEIFSIIDSINKQQSYKNQYKEFCNKASINHRKKDNEIIFRLYMMANECSEETRALIENAVKNKNTNLDFSTTLTSYIDMFAGIGNFAGNEASDAIAYWSYMLICGMQNKLNNDRIDISSINNMIYSKFGYSDTIRNFIYLITNREDNEYLNKHMSNSKSVSKSVARCMRSNAMNNLATALVSINASKLIEAGEQIDDELYYEAVSGYNKAELGNAAYTISKKFARQNTCMNKIHWEALKAELYKAIKNNKYAKLLAKQYDGMTIEELAEMLIAELIIEIKETKHTLVKSLYSEIIDDITPEVNIETVVA